MDDDIVNCSGIASIEFVWRAFQAGRYEASVAMIAMTGEDYCEASDNEPYDVDNPATGAQSVRRLLYLQSIFDYGFESSVLRKGLLAVPSVTMNPEEKQLRISNLSCYVESIQAK
jgi:hypothetical protein